MKLTWLCLDFSTFPPHCLTATTNVKQALFLSQPNLPWREDTRFCSSIAKLSIYSPAGELRGHTQQAAAGQYNWCGLNAEVWSGTSGLTVRRTQKWSKNLHVLTHMGQVEADLLISRCITWPTQTGIMEHWRDLSVLVHHTVSGTTDISRTSQHTNRVCWLIVTILHANTFYSD